MKKNVYELIIKTDASTYNVLFSNYKKAEYYKENYYKIGELYYNTIERITNTVIVKRILF